MSEDNNGIANKDISIAKTLKMLLGFIWRLDKTYYPILAFLSISNAANTVLNIFIPKILIDGLSKAWNFTTFISAILIISATKFALL